MFVIDNRVDKPDHEYMQRFTAERLKRGIRVSRNAQNLYNEYNGTAESMREYIRDKYYIDNVGSPAQVLEYIKSLAMKVSTAEKNDIFDCCFDERSKKWTTDKVALKKLELLGFEFAREILDYRAVSKYAQSIASIIKATDCNGLVHPIISVGRTNRVLYKEPGLMTIPKKLLWELISPYEEHNYLFSADIKNQEPAILIGLTNEEVLKKSLADRDGLYLSMFKKVFVQKAEMYFVACEEMQSGFKKGKELNETGIVSPAYYYPKEANSKSLYINEERIESIEVVCYTYKKGDNLSNDSIGYPSEIAVETENGNVYKVGVTWDANASVVEKGVYKLTGSLDSSSIKMEISRAERDEFKTNWLAYTYGMAKFSMINNCKLVDGATIYDFMESLKEIKKYKDTCSSLARKKVRQLRTLFGTVVDAGDCSPFALKRVLMDIPIQGTGSDIMTLLLKHVNSELERLGLSNEVSVYFPRVDEFIFEVTDRYYKEHSEKEIIDLVSSIMEHRINDWEPFLVEVSKLGAKSKLSDIIEDDETE